jgi:glyoxylate reductase
MKPKVYITRRILDDQLALIENVCEVEMWGDQEVPVPYEVLESSIGDVDGLLCLLTDRIDAALLDKAKHLKVISNMAVGYNNIDVAAATERGIMVTNTPGVLTETTADLTFALLMATARRMTESSEFLRKGEWQTWSPMLLTGQDIYGATLGIVGMGRIGEAVARRAKGFDMKIVYHNRTRKPDVESELGATWVDMESLLKASDFVCVLTPYTAETANLIGRRELALMKKSAILINTARGGIVNEEALYEALSDGTIWAAGLDVFEKEPVSPDHPLLTLPNVTALPHIGSASIRTRRRMMELSVEHLLAAISGQRPKNVVNPEVIL